MKLVQDAERRLSHHDPMRKIRMMRERALMELESELIELKRAPSRTLMKTVVAFANTHGGLPGGATLKQRSGGCGHIVGARLLVEQIYHSML